MLHAFRTVTSGAPDELTLWAQFLQFPPITEVPEPLRGGSFIAVDVAYLGSADDVAPLLALFREIPGIVLDTLGTLGTMPISLLGTIAAEPVDPTPTAEISWLMGDLDDNAIEALIALVGHGSGSPLAVVQLRHLGGAFRRASEDDGPTGAVNEPYLLFGLAVLTAPETLVDAEITFGELTSALEGRFTGRSLFNLLMADSDPTRAFSATALTRLQQIKRTVDPDQVLVSNRPVVAARTAHPMAQPS
ncbi:MAG TPA: hypothetical protein VFC16_05510 [Nakamurella sp.]|nr:hypothetical protein [Nakamurella sp.]